MTKPEANKIYGEIDTNRDGTISYNEFFFFLFLIFSIINNNRFLQAVLRYQWDSSLLVSSEKKVKEQTYEWEIPYEELEIGEKLGEGTFGIVYKAKWRGTTVAVKELKSKMLGDEQLNEFRKEIAILAAFRHPNIVLYVLIFLYLIFYFLFSFFLNFKDGSFNSNASLVHGY